MVSFPSWAKNAFLGDGEEDASPVMQQQFTLLVPLARRSAVGAHGGRFLCMECLAF